MLYLLANSNSHLYLGEFQILFLVPVAFRMQCLLPTNHFHLYLIAYIWHLKSPYSFLYFRCLFFPSHYNLPFELLLTLIPIHIKEHRTWEVCLYLLYLLSLHRLVINYRNYGSKMLVLNNIIPSECKCPCLNTIYFSVVHFIIAYWDTLAVRCRILLPNVMDNGITIRTLTINLVGYCYGLDHCFVP